MFSMIRCLRIQLCMIISLIKRCAWLLYCWIIISACTTAIVAAFITATVAVTSAIIITTTAATSSITTATTAFTTLASSSTVNATSSRRSLRFCGISIHTATSSASSANDYMIVVFVLYSSC
jgi:hypothetical protein